MALPTVAETDINVLVAGLGPFGHFKHNAGWSAIAPLHDTFLDPWSPPRASGQDVSAAAQHTRIHLQTLQIPMHYPTVLDLIPRVHGNEPSSPYASPWLDPKGAQDQLAGDGRSYPAGYRVRHPARGWDVVLHVGVGKPGSMSVETVARKTGYKGRDTDGNFPPPLHTYARVHSSSPTTSISSSSSTTRSSSSGYSGTTGASSPELGSPSARSESPPPSPGPGPTWSPADSRQLRRRVSKTSFRGKVPLPRLGDHWYGSVPGALRGHDDEEALSETQRARKRLRSHRKFLERWPRGVEDTRHFLDKRPAGGFEEGYETFADVEVADLDAGLLVDWLKQMSYVNVTESQDGGGWLCEFILYCSLCEARRVSDSSRRRAAPLQIGASTTSPSSASKRRAKVLFIHCPPVGEPLSVKEIRAAVQAVVWWVCTQDRTRGASLLEHVPRQARYLAMQ